MYASPAPLLLPAAPLPPPTLSQVRIFSRYTASEPRSAIWESGDVLSEISVVGAVACWNNKHVNILTLHNFLSLHRLNVLK